MSAYPYDWGRMYRELGISLDYPMAKGFPPQREAHAFDLVAVDHGQRLLRPAASAWRALTHHAARVGLVLGCHSGFRDVSEQVTICRDLLSKGWTPDRVMLGVAPPGFSEHHTGRAVDVMDASGTKLTATSPELPWLLGNAGHYGFRMSYPPGNPLLIHEPWHWYFVG